MARSLEGGIRHPPEGGRSEAGSPSEHLLASKAWVDQSKVDNTADDSLGFRLLPAGNVNQGATRNQGTIAFFWAASEHDDSTANYGAVSAASIPMQFAFPYDGYKANGSSLRCLRD